MAKVRTNPVSIKTRGQAKNMQAARQQKTVRVPPAANPLYQFVGPDNTFTGASWNQAKAAGYNDQQLQEYLSGENKFSLGNRVQSVVKDFNSITSPAPDMPAGYDPRGGGSTIAPSYASRPDIMFSPINIEGNKNMWGNPLSNRIVTSVVGDGKNWQDPGNAAELAGFYTPEARMKTLNTTWAMSDLNPNLQQNMAAFMDSGHAESLITGKVPGSVNMGSAITPLSQAYSEQLASSPVSSTAATTETTPASPVRNEPVRVGRKPNKAVFAGEEGAEKEGPISAAKTFAKNKAGEIKGKGQRPMSGVVERAIADRGKTVAQKKDSVLKGTREKMGISEEKRTDFAKRSSESKKAKATQAPARQAPATQAPVRTAPARQAPAGRAPVRQAAPARQSAPRQAPARQAPAGRAPARQAPARQAAPGRQPAGRNRR